MGVKSSKNSLITNEKTGGREEAGGRGCVWVCGLESTSTFVAHHAFLGLLRAGSRTLFSKSSLPHPQLCSRPNGDACSACWSSFSATLLGGVCGQACRPGEERARSVMFGAVQEETGSRGIQFLLSESGIKST